MLGTLAGLDGIASYAAGVAVLLHRAPLALLVLTYPGRRLRSAAARGLALAALLAPFAPGEAPAATAAVAGLIALATAVAAARAPAALRAPQSAAAATGTAIAITAGLAVMEVGSATQLLVAYDAVLLVTAAGLLGTWPPGAGVPPPPPAWSSSSAPRRPVLR